jgi:DNA-binding beta-propeller fold protein YncE
VRTIDMVNGGSTIRATLYGVEPLDDINSTDSLDANVVVVHNRRGPLPGELQELDACTGELTVVGELATGNLPGIAFGPSQELYALDNVANTLVRLDTSTAAETTVMGLGLDLVKTGMAYDCSSERIWVADMDGAQVFYIDIATSTIAGHVPTSVPFESVGLEFDHGTGLLVASTGKEIWTIEPNTGASSLLVALKDMEFVNDLAFFPPCP